MYSLRRDPVVIRGGQVTQAGDPVGRQNLRAVLDSASAGFVTTVARDSERYLVISAEQQRGDLAKLRPARAEVIAEGGGWVVEFVELSTDEQLRDWILDGAAAATGSMDVGLTVPA